MIVWTEQFSIGVKKLDEQHRQLFTIVNDLLQNRNADADSELIADILERMTKYTDDHFKTEERVMMEYGYPDYPLQVKEHTEFKTKTATFCMDAIARKTSLSGEMFDYLQKWLIHHILQSDLRFRDFLIENGFAPNLSRCRLDQAVPGTTTSPSHN